MAGLAPRSCLLLSTPARWASRFAPGDQERARGFVSSRLIGVCTAASCATDCATEKEARRLRPTAEGLQRRQRARHTKVRGWSMGAWLGLARPGSNRRLLHRRCTAGLYA